MMPVPKYAQVVFPLPFRNAFTYLIPDEFTESVKVGVRVVVPFGKRVLTGFVVGVSGKTDLKGKIKKISDVLDEKPIFNKKSLKFYEWVSDYYLSSLGEALKNSVPYGTDIESKKKIVADKELCEELFFREKKKKSIKGKILEALAEKEVYKISQLQKRIKHKNIHAVLKTLEKAGVLSVLNEIEDAKVRVKKAKYVKLGKPIDEIYEAIPELERKSPKQLVILLELISSKEKAGQVADILKKTKTHQASVNSLAEKGLVKIYDKEVERVYVETYSEDLMDLTLTGKQVEVIKQVSENISKNKFEPYLLHGVTGSGKTQVYIELAKKTIEEKKSILILVPEISLTPQITSRFYNNFGSIITMLHSRMSLGERYDSWRGIIAGKYKIVIGPRSALFAPLENIGLIIVDEEHDSSYKQYDNVPRYNARDIAVIRAKFSDCPVVLGSATPSVESKYNAGNGKYKLLELPERVDNAKLPRITFVDITLEKKKKRLEGVFSKALLDKIADRIKKKEGVIILQNRRGFATHVYCEDCGEIVMCPDCSVSMVHHINKNILKCHYCDITQPAPKACRNCGSISLNYFGTGTQKVEDELQFYFPDVKIERVDSDSITKKGKLGEVLNQFRKGEIDILVGTQMVSKGLDFSNVTLVGVISAETTLWLPDFRADERTFQLLTQVSGRAGRSKVEGEVIIQTQNKNNFVLQKVLENDYRGFYENEISLREQGGYPPFTKICLIETRDQNENKARSAINDFFKILKEKQKGLQLTTPTEAIIARIKGFYRFHVLVKSQRNYDPSGRILREAVLNTYLEFNQKSRHRDVKLTIDVDPQSIM